MCRRPSVRVETFDLKHMRHELHAHAARLEQTFNVSCRVPAPLHIVRPGVRARQDACVSRVGFSAIRRTTSLGSSPRLRCKQILCSETSPRSYRTCSLPSKERSPLLYFFVNSSITSITKAVNSLVARCLESDRWRDR